MDFSVTELSCMDPALCLGGEGSFFPFGLEKLNNEMGTETNTAQVSLSAKEWRNGNQVHRPTSQPSCERDFILKSKDKGGRNEANDEEALVYLKGGRAFSESEATPFLSFFGP